MPVTPFELRLLRVANEANQANDSDSLSLITRMLERVRRGEYSELRGQFEMLRPIYRGRLGELPASRNEDKD